MADLNIRLLGQFQVTLNREAVINFASDKVRALLAYLTTEIHCPHRREILANLLWPDKPDVTARASLRRALADLRQVISDHQAITPFLLISRQDIRFNVESSAWVDVHALEQIHSLQAPSPQNISQYDPILDIYRGEFLAGFSLSGSTIFDEWALMMREQSARKVIAILARVSSYYESRREYQSALPFAWRNVELEPWQEAACRQLMRLLAFAGQRDEALQQYQKLAHALSIELDIEPEPKTRQLFEAILDGTQEIPSEAPPRIADRPTTIAIPDYFQEEEPTQIRQPETFVARQHELDKLHKLLKSVVNGNGTVAMIAGEAGSGKSMLIREFVRQAQVHYPNLVSATGFSNAFTGLGDPYLPFREILYQLSGDVKKHWKAGAFSRQYTLNLWKTIPTTCQALLNHGPDLVGTIITGQTLLEHAASYSKTLLSWYPTLEALVNLKQMHPGSGVHQANLFSQLTAVLQDISAEFPLLLVMEDLQWVDTGTISMLFHLCKHLSGTKIMVLGAYRSDEVNLIQEDSRHSLIPVLHEIKRDFGDVFIDLDLASGKNFVQELIASEPNILGNEFQDQLFNLTGGHALFTVEILRALQEMGVLIKDRHGFWVMKSDFHLEELPPRIEGIIAERIGRLPKNLQQILTIASIEGEVFTAEIIAALEEQAVTKIISLLSDQLDKQHRLVQAQQFSRQANQTISSYRFRHFLFQKYLYDQLDKIEIPRFHERVGSTMEKIAEENKDPYLVHLARHYHKAGLTEKAITYHALAGQRAVQMSAYPEAITQFESAIDLLNTLPPTSTRDEQELGLRLQLGLAYQAIMGFAHPTVGQAYQRAWAICQTGGDPYKVIDTVKLLFSYYSNMAEFGTADEIMTMLQKLIDELDETDPAYIHQVHWGYGYMDSLLGRFKSALENFELALKYHDPETFKSVAESVGMEPGIYCHGWGGLHAAWLGYPDQAKTHIQSAFQIAGSYESKLFSADALWFSAWTCLEIQDISAARDYARSALEIATQEKYFLIEAMARVFHGRVMSIDGMHNEAIECIQQALEIYRMTGLVAAEPIWLHGLAEVYYRAGMIQEGLEMIQRAEKTIQDTGETRHKAFILKIKGDLLWSGGDVSTAEQAYLNAIAVAQEQSAKLVELETVKVLARIWQQQGKTNQAKKELQTIYAWFTEGFDTPMLIEAKALLDTLSSTQ